MIDQVDQLVCKGCGEVFRPALRAGCPRCADGGRLRFSYRLEGLAPFDRGAWSRREGWLWRFRELLPFDHDFVPPPLQVGMTPLYGSPRLARFAGVRGIFVKDESANPGRSVYGRSAALCCAGARGRTAVSGPLCGELAAFAASAELPLCALANSELAERAALAYGARVARLVGLDPESALREAAGAGLYLADRPNPLCFEGLKTLGLEIGEQLAERPADWIVLDAWTPDLVEAVRAGLCQLQALGLVRELPRFLVVGEDETAEAQIEVGPERAAEAARAMTAALGVPATAGRGLAGLARAVARGLVEPEALALVVAEGPAPEFSACSLPAATEVRSSEELGAWLDAGC